MLAWLGALLIVSAFLGLAHVLRLVPAARRVLAVVENAFAILGDGALDDDAKETAMQRHALRSFGLFLWIAGGALVALLLPLVGLWFADRLGWVDGDQVLDVTVSLPFLLLSTLAGIAVWRWKAQQRRRQPALTATFENRYSASDRLLHQIAFSTADAQIAASHLEDRLHARRLARIPVKRPVFITALPRAGTTLLLELIDGMDEFVTHTYRRMPFVLTPLWWEKLSRPFRIDAPPQPRAHGDGMLVGLESPEAMEEVLWLAHWPEHYAEDLVHPWRARRVDAAFAEEFHQHIRKLIAAAGADRTAGEPRYISKNNLNIARVRWLPAMFPDARVLIPFRSPLQHAASLLRQHRNFLAIHARDAFARRYMAAIGHFDFGANLRPVNFDDWLADVPEAPTDLSFWLRYWAASYRSLLRVRDDRVRFFDFDTFCREPAHALEVLGEFIEIADRPRLIAAHSRVHAPAAHPVDTTQVAPNLMRTAMQVHQELVARSLIRGRAPVMTGTSG